MKKASKPTSKKPAAKTPAAKKSSSKPKRKAEQHSQLAQVVMRLEIVADKLTQTAEHLAELAAGVSHPGEHQEEPRHDSTDPPDFSAAPLSGQGRDPTDGVSEK